MWRPKPTRSHLPLLIALLLVLLTAGVFWPVRDYGFVAWDDDIHVYANPHFQPLSLSHVLALWQAPYQKLYIPLTYTLWAGVVRLGQGAAGGFEPHLFHRLNLMLHLLSVLVVFRLVRLLLIGATPEAGGGESRERLEWAAASGAAVFALHPLQVEAVAWVTGLKDVLGGLLSLVAVWQYLCYIQAANQARTQGGWHFGLATVAFGLALLAKPVAVAVPLIAGVLTVWQVGRVGRGPGLRLLGWGIVAVGWGLWTSRMQPATLLPFVPPLWARPLIAGDAVSFYLAKLVVPLGLAPDYGRTPQWVWEQGWWYVTGIGPWLIGLGLWCGRRRVAWMGAAAAVFVSGLVPVLGFIPFDFQYHYSTVADRYVYVALLGPALGLAWGAFGERALPVGTMLVQPPRQHRRGVRWWGVGSVLIVGLLGLRSAHQVQYWRDSTTLLEHALRVNAASAMAHNNLGVALFRQGKVAEAKAHYIQAMQLELTFTSLSNLCDAIASPDRIEEAVTCYSRSLDLFPDSVKAHNKLGSLLAQQGKLTEAIGHFSTVLRLEPEHGIAHYNLGNALVIQGKLAEGITHYTEALRLMPAYVKAYHNLGMALSSQGKTAEAIMAYRNALRYRPNWLQAMVNLAWVLATQATPSRSDAAEAMRLAEAVCRVTDYKNALALHTLAAAYAAAGRQAEAVSATRQALAAAEASGETALADRIRAWQYRYEKEYTLEVMP